MRTKYANVITILGSIDVVSKTQKRICINDIARYIYAHHTSPSNYSSLLNMLNDIIAHGYAKKNKRRHKTYITLTQKGKMLLSLDKATPQKKKKVTKKQSVEKNKHGKKENRST